VSYKFSLIGPIVVEMKKDIFGIELPSVFPPKKRRERCF
jgi:hypothetical protein